ncbi:MAG: hypothetical protein QOH56_891 [Pseudonocardiales bacterium]|nr:hypothetical protein [Pseudonocardiales bacterium]
MGELRRQFGAALATTRRQDGAAGAGTHPKPEAVGLGPTAVVRLEGPLAHGLAPSHQLGINTSGGDRSAAGRGWPRRWGLLGRWGCSNSVTARILLCALPVHAFPVMPEAQRKGARNLNSTDSSLPRSNRVARWRGWTANSQRSRARRGGRAAYCAPSRRPTDHLSDHEGGGSRRHAEGILETMLIRTPGIVDNARSLLRCPLELNALRISPSTVVVRFAGYVHHVIGTMVVVRHSFHTLWITLWTNLRGLWLTQVAHR